jgi:hypothetical protein
MDSLSGLFSTQALRRVFGGSAALIERRSQRLPVAVERRQGPPCENCTVGTLHPIPANEANAGQLRCDSPGCGHIAASGSQAARDAMARDAMARDAMARDAMECVIRAS